VQGIAYCDSNPRNFPLVLAPLDSQALLGSLTNNGICVLNCVLILPQATLRCQYQAEKVARFLIFLFFRIEENLL
jgi:hypothetical protein